jgi:hypothetical protein
MRIDQDSAWLNNAEYLYADMYTCIDSSAFAFKTLPRMAISIDYPIR